MSCLHPWRPATNDLAGWCAFRERVVFNLAGAERLAATGNRLAAQVVSELKADLANCDREIGARCASSADVRASIKHDEFELRGARL